MVGVGNQVKRQSFDRLHNLFAHTAATYMDEEVIEWICPWLAQ